MGVKLLAWGQFLAQEAPSYGPKLVAYDDT